MNFTLNKFKLLLHTIRYLTFQQVAYRVYYQLKRKFYTWKPDRINQQLKTTKLDIQVRPILFQESGIPHYQGDIEDLLNNKITFLNQKFEFEATINWQNPALNVGTRLWKLNLNYHEYLIDVARIYEKSGQQRYLQYIQQHISNWCDQNPFGTPAYYKDNWNSYAISLRCMAWIKVFNLVGDHFTEDFRGKITNSICVQYDFLSNNLEWDLKGNHLLENSFALLFSAYFFKDQSLLDQATSLLNQELKEQILPDGGHYELSPMYHQLLLFRVLDCYNLVKNNPPLDSKLLNLLKEKAEIMLGWLLQITFQNGDIPLLNDAAFKVSPTTKALRAYAEKLGITKKIISLKESGYRKINKKNYEIIIDIGQIGPDYIPGHAHSDTFNFVLYVDQQPFIVDTGTSTYNPTARRQLERSTAAHNTVQIGNWEQSETWASFRVARRAYPQIIVDSETKIAAKLKYATQDVWHHRTFQFATKSIIIEDRVEAKQMAKAIYHFHPTAAVTIANQSIQTNFGTIEFKGAQKIVLASYDYAPEFNRLIPAQKAIITFQKNLLTKFHYENPIYNR